MGLMHLPSQGDYNLTHWIQMHKEGKTPFMLVTSLSFLIFSAFKQAFPKPGGWCGPTTEVIAFPLSHLSNELIENQVRDLQNQDNNKIIMILLAIWPQCWFLLPEKHCHVNRKTHQSQKSHKSQANWLPCTHSIAGETMSLMRSSFSWKNPISTLIDIAALFRGDPGKQAVM